MAALKLQTLEKLKLRELGHDEIWLQDKIEANPMILGLGDVRVIAREHKQSSGGRIDFLLKDDENEIVYETEVMLGAVDESHIIRTIEYWDVEQRKNPQLDHVAVIIAEEITDRFFNVISLMNKAIPIIAIKLEATKFQKNLFLNFIRILDNQERGDVEEDIQEQRADRAYWEKRASKESMRVVDNVQKFLKSLKMDSGITYNRGHLAFSAKRRNFFWPQPRVSGNYCYMEVFVGPNNSENCIKLLEKAGIPANYRGAGRKKIAFKLDLEGLLKGKKVLSKIFRIAYDYCS